MTGSSSFFFALASLAGSALGSFGFSQRATWGVKNVSSGLPVGCGLGSGGLPGSRQRGRFCASQASPPTISTNNTSGKINRAALLRGGRASEIGVDMRLIIHGVYRLRLRSRVKSVTKDV